MEIGDTLVFIGENIEDHHFKNFNYGQQYVIKYFNSDLPDTDQYGNHIAVFFQNHMWGCLMCKIPKYFVSLDEFRNINIKNIIND